MLSRIAHLALAPALALIWAVPAMTAELPVETTVWAPPSPQAPAASWSPRLAELFPGCLAELPKDEIPATVVWVRDGWPVRVAFAKAWARTHDGDDDNHGEVVALCR